MEKEIRIRIIKLGSLQEIGKRPRLGSSNVLKDQCLRATYYYYLHTVQRHQTWAPTNKLVHQFQLAQRAMEQAVLGKILQPYIESFTWE